MLGGIRVGGTCCTAGRQAGGTAVPVAPCVREEWEGMTETSTWCGGAGGGAAAGSLEANVGFEVANTASWLG